MIYINSNIATNAWCIYTLTEQGGEKPDFAWYCKASNVMAIIDALKNPDFRHESNYLLKIESFHTSRLEASNAISAWLKANGWPPLNLTQWQNRHNPVRCDSTGQVFRNASEAAQLLGLNRSQLSQHLRRNPGYRTIKGMTFTNVSCAPYVNGGKPL